MQTATCDPKPEKAATQLELLCLEMGVSTAAALPGGVSELSAKEVKFITAFLRHGRPGLAAEEAGYSKATAPQIAHELFTRPHIQRFYRHCTAKLANDTSSLVERVWERSRTLHAKFLTSLDDPKKARTYGQLAGQTDTLLATLLGKLKVNVELSGEVGLTVRQEDLDMLAESRRKWETAGGRN